MFLMATKCQQVYSLQSLDKSKQQIDFEGGGITLWHESTGPDVKLSQSNHLLLARFEHQCWLS